MVTIQGPASLTSLTPDHQLREDFTILAKDLVASLKSVVTAMGPASLTSLTPDHQLREDFTILAKDLVASLKSVRLCEELEYSELLDSAAECKSSVERMALIAAFAVSAYAGSAHRAASKPFNPLLAETYECVRDDRGFRFLAEQEARIKTKFWGKSMEFQPTGRVHVRLNTTGDHYTWNKSRHEVRGAVTGRGVRLRLQGRWSEALYAGDPPAARCLWRP
ncbi:Oxysterol-binding protein, partial [Operophtera brumata]